MTARRTAAGTRAGARFAFWRSARWKPAPLLLFSALLAVLLLLAVGLRPSWWPWLLLVFVLNHVLLAAVGCWPRSRWLGPNLVRLPPAAVARHEVAVTFDDGPDPVLTPRVLDCLERFGARASFFCCAKRAQAHPDLVHEILRRGHSVENHSWRHAHGFAAYGWWRLKRELQRSQAILGRLVGYQPKFFRAPMGLRNPLLDPLLALHDLQLVSWTRRGFDTVDANAGRVRRRLLKGLAAGDILLLHDGHASHTPDGEAVLMLVLPAVLQRCRELELRVVSLPMACCPDAAGGDRGCKLLLCEPQARSQLPARSSG